MALPLFQEKYGEVNEFYMSRGLIHLDMEQRDEAQSDFRKAMALSTQIVSAIKLVVQMLMEFQLFDEAMKRTSKQKILLDFSVSLPTLYLFRLTEETNIFSYLKHFLLRETVDHLGLPLGPIHYGHV